VAGGTEWIRRPNRSNCFDAPFGIDNSTSTDITAKDCAFQHTLRSVNAADASSPVSAPIRPSALSTSGSGAQGRGQLLVAAADRERAVFWLH
jgi:hypothetical protein